MKNTELEAIIEKYDLVGKSLDEVTEKIIPTKFKTIDVLSHINQHYAIKPDVMRELKKDENVRRILDGKIELEVGKWHEIITKDNFKFNVLYSETDENGTKTNDEVYGIGLDVTCDDWYLGFTNWCKVDQIKSVRLMTPEEIQSMLVKKLEADGLKVGCKIDRSEIVNYPDRFEIITIKDMCFDYNPDKDTLNVNGWRVYAKGKFAKIIQPELTIEQKMEILWNERNAKLI